MTSALTDNDNSGGPARIESSQPRVDGVDRRPSNRQRWWIALVAAVVVVILTAVYLTRPPAPLFYSAKSPVNVRIPVNPVLDPNNDQWSSYAAESRFSLSTFRYGMAVVQADGSEQRFHVQTDRDADWGSALGPYTVPLRPEWRATTGSDGWLCVIDADHSRGYWLWQYSWNDGKPTATWGGTGRYDQNIKDPWADYGSGGGSGVVPPSLVIMKADLDRGSINHALATADPWTASSWKYPAKSSDGEDEGSTPIPEGQRIQLDPSIKVDSEPWSRIEKMVAKALQTYGAYIVDTSDGSMALSGQMDQTQKGNDPGKMWTNVGVTREFQDFGNIPTDKLRFLKNWDGK